MMMVPYMFNDDLMDDLFNEFFIAFAAEICIIRTR